MVEVNALSDGDTFVVDNASVHFAADNMEELTALLHEAGVRLVFTPTYSPEYNPCELIFGQVKRYIRKHLLEQSSFLSVVYEAFSHVSYSNVLNYYDSCTSSRSH